MVYLALDSTAAREAIAFARKTECSVWVGSDALDLYEFQSLIAQGVKVTRFSLPLLAASSELVESVASVVKQHHPMRLSGFSTLLGSEEHDPFNREQL